MEKELEAVVHTAVGFALFTARSAFPPSSASLQQRVSSSMRTEEEAGPPRSAAGLRLACFLVLQATLALTVACRPACIASLSYLFVVLLPGPAPAPLAPLLALSCAAAATIAHLVNEATAAAAVRAAEADLLVLSFAFGSLLLEAAVGGFGHRLSHALHECKVWRPSSTVPLSLPTRVAAAAVAALCPCALGVTLLVAGVRSLTARRGVGAAARLAKKTGDPAPRGGGLRITLVYDGWVAALFRLYVGSWAVGWYAVHLLVRHGEVDPTSARGDFLTLVGLPLLPQLLPAGLLAQGASSGAAGGLRQDDVLSSAQAAALLALAALLAMPRVNLTTQFAPSDRLPLGGGVSVAARLPGGGRSTTAEAPVEPQGPHGSTQTLLSRLSARLPAWPTAEIAATLGATIQLAWTLVSLSLANLLLLSVGLLALLAAPLWPWDAPAPSARAARFRGLARPGGRTLRPGDLPLPCARRLRFVFARCLALRPLPESLPCAVWLRGCLRGAGAWTVTAYLTMAAWRFLLDDDLSAGHDGDVGWGGVGPVADQGSNQAQTRAWLRVALVRLGLLPEPSASAWLWRDAAAGRVRADASVAWMLLSMLALLSATALAAALHDAGAEALAAATSPRAGQPGEQRPGPQRGSSTGVVRCPASPPLHPRHLARASTDGLGPRSRPPPTTALRMTRTATSQPAAHAQLGVAVSVAAVTLLAGSSVAEEVLAIAEDTAEAAARAPGAALTAARSGLALLLWHSQYAPLLLLILAARAPFSEAGVAHVVWLVLFCWLGSVPTRQCRRLWAAPQAVCAAVCVAQAAWCAAFQPVALLGPEGDTGWGDGVASGYGPVPAQLCWSLALAPLLACQGVLFGSPYFRAAAARRAWACAAARHVRPPCAEDAHSSPAEALQESSVSRAGLSAGLLLLKRIRRRTQQRSFANALRRAASEALATLAPLGAPLADTVFAVSAALLPGVRLMGLLYVFNLLLHLLARETRPTGWHNALRQGALSLELLVWGIQRLAADLYKGLTGGDSLSLLELAGPLCEVAPGSCDTAAGFLDSNAFFAPRSLIALALLSVVSSRLARTSADASNAYASQRRPPPQSPEEGAYGSEGEGEEGPASPASPSAAAPLVGGGASWAGLLSSVALYLSCVGAAFAGEADALRAALLLSALACTFGGGAAELTQGEQRSRRRSHSLGAPSDGWGALPHSTLLCRLWLPVGLLSALDILFIYSLDLGSLGLGLHAQAHPTNSTPAADESDYYTRHAPNVRWLSSAADLAADSRGVWQLANAMRAAVALHLLAVAQQVLHGHLARHRAAAAAAAASAAPAGYSPVARTGAPPFSAPRRRQSTRLRLSSRVAPSVDAARLLLPWAAGAVLVASAATSPTAWALPLLLAAALLRLLPPSSSPSSRSSSSASSSSSSSSSSSASSSQGSWSGRAGPFAWLGARCLLACFVACAYLADISLPPAVWPAPRRPWATWQAEWAPAAGQCAGLNSTGVSPPSLEELSGVSPPPSEEPHSGLVCWLGLAGERHTASALLAVLALTLCALCRDFALPPPRGAAASFAEERLRRLLDAWPVREALPLLGILATLYAFATADPSLLSCVGGGIALYALASAASPLALGARPWRALRATAYLALFSLALFQSPLVPPRCRPADVRFLEVIPPPLQYRRVRGVPHWYRLWTVAQKQRNKALSHWRTLHMFGIVVVLSGPASRMVRTRLHHTRPAPLRRAGTPRHLRPGNGARRAPVGPL